MWSSRKSHRLLAVANCLLAVVIFIGDLAVPLAIAGGVLYVIVVLVSMWLSRRQVFAFAVTCTVLIVVGFLASPEDYGPASLTNRLLSTFSVWVVAVLGLRVRNLAYNVVRQARIIDEVRDAIIVGDRHGRVDYCNRSAETIFGYPSQHLIGRPLASLFVAKQQDRLEGFMQECGRSQGPTELELTGVRSDGERFLARQWLICRYDDQDDPSGMILHVQDLSQSQPAGIAARRMETFYRDLLDKLPFQVALFDTSGRFLYLNPASLTDPVMRTWIIGKTEREYAERVQRNLQTMDNRAIHFQRALREKKPVNFEETFQPKQGEPRYFRHGFFPAIDSKGDVTTVLGYRYDITEHRGAERRLRRYTDRLEGLRRIDHAILTAQSPGAVAEVAGHHLLQMTSADQTSIHLLNSHDDSWDGLTVLPDGSTRHESVAPYKSFETLEAAETRDDSDPITGHPVRIIRYEDWRIDIPLCVQDSFIGVLALVRADMEAFVDSDVEIARDVAGLLAVALHDARLFEEIDESHKRLRALSRRLVDVQEEERRRLARELHDEVGQALTGLKLSLETAGQLVGSQRDSSVGEAKNAVQQLLSRVRNLSLDLRPAMLDDLGLIPALLWLVDRYERQTRITVDFRHAVSRRLNPEVETAAYRIVQEALTNVARYSGVRKAAVMVTESEDKLLVKVKDSGVGFDLRRKTPDVSGSGLSGLQERVGLLRGELVVETAPNQGTCLTASLPINGKPE